MEQHRGARGTREVLRLKPDESPWRFMVVAIVVGLAFIAFAVRLATAGDEVDLSLGDISPDSRRTFGRVLVIALIGSLSAAVRYLAEARGWLSVITARRFASGWQIGTPWAVRFRFAAQVGGGAKVSIQTEPHTHWLWPKLPCHQIRLVAATSTSTYIVFTSTPEPVLLRLREALDQLERDGVTA